MAKSSITALCASKNVLCEHKDGHTFKYFVVPGLHHRYHISCWADQPQIRKSNENPCSRESRLVVKQKRHCWILHLRWALQFLISAIQQNTPGWKIWYHQQWWQNSRPREGFYSIIWNMTLRVTLSHWKTKPGDNSYEVGPQPRTQALFYRQVFHRHMLAGSSCTMRLWAQIRHNTEMPICAHDVPKTCFILHYKKNLLKYLFKKNFKKKEKTLTSASFPFLQFLYKQRNHPPHSSTLPTHSPYEGYNCQNKMSQLSFCSSNVTKTYITSTSLTTWK